MTEQIFFLSRGTIGSSRIPLSATHESAKLPLAIKENDVEYQFHRVVMFSRLLGSYPHSYELILSEAMIDICPLLRGEIWAALLQVKVIDSSFDQIHF